MKKVLLILLVLALLTVSGIVFYIASIDWNQHKDKIATRFNEMTGKAITFDGPVSFQIFPSPYLTASNVRIYNKGLMAETPLVEIKDLVAELALSPLLSGAFDVKKMVLQDAKINVEILNDGKINWQSPLNPEQRLNLEKEQIRLNSVSLVNATLAYNDNKRDIEIELTNLNGEIVAQSVFGPYRIEGNYIKDNNPEGFAISVGKISDGFATPLNLAVSHPLSKSYIRFDGSIMLDNNAFNGNIIIDSENIMNFAKANFKNINFDKAYNYPLALTFDIESNDFQTNLNNMVIKYGETQGAGSVQIPAIDSNYADEDTRQRIEMAFNFTNFNLDPVVFFVKQIIDEYKNGEKAFVIDSKFDIIADIKSLRTQYKEQPIKDFATSFDIQGNNIAINNLKATLPGDTDIKIKGDIYAQDEEPNYNLDVSFNSNDFLRTINWLGFQPQQNVASTYKKSMGSAKILGNMQKIQVSPFNLTMDKSSLNGEAGFKLGKRNDAMLVLNADMINFDNYISQLPKEEQGKNLTQRMQYRFTQLGILNDFEMEIGAKIDLCIYDGMPFEKVDLKATLLNGNLDIKDLSIASMANAQLNLSGNLKGFGKTPTYENLKYSIKTSDVAALINKFEFKAPALDYKVLKNFESKGIATGSLDKSAVKIISKLENLEFSYGGQITKNGDSFIYNGNLDAKHPDFVNMINSLNLKYNPQIYSLGAFALKSKINGNIKAFRAEPLEINVGFNQFNGDLNYDNNNERPNILTNLTINRFEIERFFTQNIEKDGKTAIIQPVTQPEKAEFLTKPFWSKERFNFDFYKGFDLSGKFKLGELSYKKYNLQNADIELDLHKGELNLTKFEGAWKNGGRIESNATLNMNDKNQLNGRLKLTDINVANLGLFGSRYGIMSGKLASNWSFNTLADSQESLAHNLNGNADFSMNNINIKGWDLNNIYKDIIVRKSNDNLSLFITENLQNGITTFNNFSGKISFSNGGYSLSDTLIKGGAVNLGVFGDGSIAAWDMNVLFNVKYNEPKYLPGYSFSLKGPMNNPLVDVNVSALFELYKSQQDKIIAQQKAVEESRLKSLQNLVDEQKNIAQNIFNELQNNVKATLNDKIVNIVDKDILKDFNGLAQNIEQQIQTAGNIISSGQSTNVDEALIAEMTNKNLQASKNLETVKSSLQKLYVKNLQSQLGAPFNSIIEIYNNAKMEKNTYSENMQNWQARLAAIKTNYKLEEDKEIIAWQQFIEDKAMLLDGQNNPLLDRYSEMLKSEKTADLEEYILSLEDTLALANEDIKAMQDSLDKLEIYSEQKVSAEEDAYQNKLRSEEIKRKLEENTGYIANEKTGKNIIVQRDIDEIEKAQELTTNEVIKVLDFTKDRPGGVTQKSDNKNPVKRRK